MISIIIISKDEEGLNETLADVTSQARAISDSAEVVVVDASDGRLNHIQLRHQSDVRWVKFDQPTGVGVTIPHQRNVGVNAAHGEIIVFTDAGCRPEHEWLDRLIAPLYKGESITSGLTLGTPGSGRLYDRLARKAMESKYLAQCATINLAFRREVFDAINGFDEGFAYGSDIDFSWRLRDTGYSIRGVPAAVVRHDWGTRRRQMRRSYLYGKARMRLYKKHHSRLRYVLREDPTLVIYPVFLLGLPLTLILPFYPALLLIPAWRNRSDGPARVVMDHLAYGVGALVEFVGRLLIRCWLPYGTGMPYLSPWPGRSGIGTLLLAPPIALRVVHEGSHSDPHSHAKAAASRSIRLMLLDSLEDLG